MTAQQPPVVPMHARTLSGHQALARLKAAGRQPVETRRAASVRVAARRGPESRAVEYRGRAAPVTLNATACKGFVMMTEPRGLDEYDRRQRWLQEWFAAGGSALAWVESINPGAVERMGI